MRRTDDHHLPLFLRLFPRRGAWIVVTPYLQRVNAIISAWQRIATPIRKQARPPNSTPFLLLQVDVLARRSANTDSLIESGQKAVRRHPLREGHTFLRPLEFIALVLP